MKKKEFLDRIIRSRTKLERELSGIPAEILETGKTIGTWSIKDVIAHIGWYEGEMIKVLNSMALIGSEFWKLDLQDRNKAIHAANSSKDLQEVINTEKDNFRKMLSLLQDLDESALNDAGAFSEMPPDWQPWSVIASNTYEHYDDHRKDIKKLTTDN